MDFDTIMKIIWYPVGIYVFFAIYYSDKIEEKFKKIFKKNG